MIRALQPADLDRVADLWLAANLQVHPFIAPEYWRSHRRLVKELLPQAEVYIYEDAGEIQGFAGLNGTYIEGIFVSEKMRSQGIGKCLLDFLKTKRTRLCLNVYQKNVRAIRFYEREGFRLRCEGVDEATGEKDFVMVWGAIGTSDAPREEQL